MNNIYSGPAATRFGVSNDGMAHATTFGLFLSSNAGDISAKLLQASTAAGARGLVIALDGVAFALPPMTPQHYRYVPESLRCIPVALVVNAEQAAFLESVQQAAASAGTLRRVFRSQEDAQGWLREHMHALSANHVWWTTSRGGLAVPAAPAPSRKPARVAAERIRPRTLR